MIPSARTVTSAALTAALLATATVFAAPAIRIVPPDRARFVAGQLFDLRVEYTPTPGATLSAVGLSIDGVAQPAGLADLDAAGGLSLRRRSYTAPGVHTIVAVATDSAGGPPATAQVGFEIVDPRGDRPRYKNLIILLGDGMGAAHRTAARIVRHGYTGGKANGRLAMDELPHTGMVMTSSLDSVVTDSAPGMSCYTTGNKASNNEEGVFPDNTEPGEDTPATAAFDNPRVEYLGEYLHRTLGKAVGIVTTADVEDATPAANAVHTADRDAGTGICDQYLDENDLPDGRGNGIAVLLGGGRRWFLPASDAYSSRSWETDYQLDPATAAALQVPAGTLDPERDLIAGFKNKGFAYADTAKGLASAAADPATTRLLGLFAHGNLNVAFDKIAKRRNPGVPGVVDDFLAPDQPLLAEMARAALAVLDRHPQGFVLTIEGAHIDKQSHAMDADRAIWDTIELDDAVRASREFADRTPGTLVIVIADHECAGFSIIGAAKPATAELAALPGDAASLEPGVTPARQKAVGRYEEAGFPAYPIAPDGYPAIADPDHKLLIGFGANSDRYESWLSKPLPIIESLLPKRLKERLAAGDTATGSRYPPGPIEREESHVGFFVRGQAPGARAVHTAADIVISAYGSPAAAQFVGYQDNTDVFFKLVRAALGGY